MKVNSSLAWCPFEGAVFVVQADGVPTDPDWDEFITDESHVVGVSVLLILGESKLTPRQRAAVQRMHEATGGRATLVTDSLAARGMMMALKWFGVKAEAFASRELGRALIAAGVAAEHHDAARALIDRLSAALAEKRRHTPAALS